MNKLSQEHKTILKFYIRLYFFLNHKLKHLSQGFNNSNKQLSKHQKKTILEQYFDEDINNINHLSNSADMFFIKPYFEYLCNNSYDDDCNSYREYLNINLKDNTDYDKISELIVEQVREYADKFNSLSLNDQFIEKIRKMLSNKKNLNKDNFIELSNTIEEFLKKSHEEKLQNDLTNLEQQIIDVESYYNIN